jgi:hypothetical protein
LLPPFHRVCLEVLPGFCNQKMSHLIEWNPLKGEVWEHFLIISPTRCTNFSNLFWNETLHVWYSSSVHHQELFTVHSAMVYVIQVCRQLLSSRIRSVQWIAPDDGQRNCLKHVEFHSKINLRNYCI